MRAVFGRGVYISGQVLTGLVFILGKCFLGQALNAAHVRILDLGVCDGHQVTRDPRPCP